MGTITICICDPGSGEDVKVTLECSNGFPTGAGALTAAQELALSMLNSIADDRIRNIKVSSEREDPNE